MVIALLMIVFLALVTIGLWAYSRSLLISAAAQAARYAANADVSSEGASLRVADIMSHTAAVSTSGTVQCSSIGSDARMVEVHCTMAAPGILSLLDGVLPEINVTGHALRERP